MTARNQPYNLTNELEACLRCPYLKTCNETTNGYKHHITFNSIPHFISKIYRPVLSGNAYKLLEFYIERSEKRPRHSNYGRVYHHGRADIEQATGIKKKRQYAFNAELAAHGLISITKQLHSTGKGLKQYNLIVLTYPKIIRRIKKQLESEEHTRQLRGVASEFTDEIATPQPINPGYRKLVQ